MPKKQKLLLVLISLGGVLFSGYLSFSKIFAGTCPLNEGCSLFLGYPACYFGFGFFFILLLLSLLQKIKLLQIISVLAVVFALYSTYIDLMYPNCPGGKCQYSLLLPTCVYGLVMYLGIFIFSFPHQKK